MCFQWCIRHTEGPEAWMLINLSYHCVHEGHTGLQGLIWTRQFLLSATCNGSNKNQFLLCCVARRWLWTSWAWGCCRPAARWRTSWQRASPVRARHVQRRLGNVSLYFASASFDTSVFFCSCGGHQQAARASAQPGGHLPDYTYREGKHTPSLTA